MTKDSFNNLENGDVVIVVKEIEFIDGNQQIRKINYGERLYFDKKYYYLPKMNQYDFKDAHWVFDFFRRKDETPTGWVITHLSINAHSHVEKVDVVRDNKIKDILS